MTRPKIGLALILVVCLMMLCTPHLSAAQTFTDIGAGLADVSGSSLAWGDYDKDGDLDLALAGDYGITEVSRIYRNDNGIFVDIGAGLTSAAGDFLAWGDFDNDGDLDLALSYSIYRNDNGTFTNIKAGFPSVESSAWGDYDNDGDLDIALAGHPILTSKIYRNDNGIFTDIGAGLPAVYYSSLAWGDYDNDGDLDLALAGGVGSSKVSKVYENNNGIFTDIGAGLTAVEYGLVAWGDIDNDGDLDLALAGSGISKIYRNNNGIFTDTGAELTGATRGSLAWGDFDNDGDLDLALAGLSASGYVSKIYRNDGGVINSDPEPPAELSASVSGSDITFNWNPAFDAQTPSSGLLYNLRVGTAPGKDDILSGMADLFSGYRRLPSIGNAQKNLSWTLKGLGSGKVYYWSVQAIDTAFAGSEWADEQVVTPYAINGKIVLGNYGGDITKVPVTIELRKQGGVVTSRTINLGEDGSFTVPNVETGTYDITFKASHWLTKIVRGVVVQ